MASGVDEGAQIYQPACPLPDKGFWFRPTVFSGVEQTIRAAFPQAAPPAGSSLPAPSALAKDPAERLRELAELHRQGVVTDAEFEVLRARLYR